jgi:hypothetical protein
MMKFLFVLLLAIGSAQAAPFIVSDPISQLPTGITAADIACVYQEGTNPSVSTPIAVWKTQSGPGCVVDFAGITGLHSYQFWYRQISTSIDLSPKAPFVFGLGAPQNLRVTQ